MVVTFRVKTARDAGIWEVVFLVSLTWLRSSLHYQDRLASSLVQLSAVVAAKVSSSLNSYANVVKLDMEVIQGNLVNYASGHLCRFIL